MLLLVSTAALLPGAFGQHDILNPGAMKNPFGEPDGFDNEPTHEQQALKFVGQSQQQSGGPPRQQQQAPPRGAQ